MMVREFLTMTQRKFFLTLLLTAIASVALFTGHVEPELWERFETVLWGGYFVVNQVDKKVKNKE